MNRNDDDRLLKDALERLPEAPRDPAFAARVASLAALTRQVGPVYTPDPDAVPAFRLVGALLGFSFGLALVLLSLLPVQSRLATPQSTAAATPLSMPTFDPLENTVASLYEAPEGSALE